MSASDIVTEPISQALQINGFNLHYWEWPSEGPAVMLLHSSSHYGRMWEWVAQRLQPTFRVVALDQRGHGDSEQPSEGNTPADYAADVAALAQSLGMERLTVAGNALGARAALVSGARYPELVHGAVLVGGPDYSTLHPGADVERWQRHAASMRQRGRGFASREAAREALAANYPWYSQVALDHELAYNLRPTANGGVAWKYDPDWVADGLLHALDDLREDAARVACPVLILRAERSWQLTDERMPEIESRLPTSRTITLAGTGPAPELEDPDAVAAAIRDCALG